MKTLLLVSSIFFCISLVTPQSKKESRKAEPEPASEAVSREGKIWGAAFVDYSYVARAMDTSRTGMNAFEFRRIYLGYDKDISSQFSARILIEANRAETTPSGVLDFFAKLAYIEWKNLLPTANIFFGLTLTPSIGLSEKYWGYRSLEKVILDRTGLVNIADMGVAVQGKITGDGTSGYAVMVGNGRGGKIENDKFKKVYGQFYVEPIRSGVVELYGDYENVENGKTRITGKGFVGYQLASFSFGAEGFYRNIHQGAFRVSGISPDSNLIGASAYGSFAVAENLRGVLRGDFFDADALVKDSGLREIFSVGGLDYTPAKDVHIMPNVLYTHHLYKAKLTTDPNLQDDITLRLTVAYYFSSQIQ